MYSATVRLSADSAVVSCPSVWLRTWGLEAGQGVRVHFGQRSVPATVAASERGKTATVWLPASARRQLLVPTGTRLNLAWTDGSLRLGPLIGVLVSLRIPPVQSPSPTRLGPQVTFFAHLCRLGRKLGAFVFIFGPRDVRWDRGEVLGVMVQGLGLRRVVLPLPDAVYIRTQSRTADRRPALVSFHRRLAKFPQIAAFNRSFFDKWELHQALSKHPQAQQYLPDTRRYTGSRDVTEMLERYRQVFIKPAGGSLGIGIVRVTRMGSGLYEYRLSLRAGDRTRLVSGLHAVTRKIRALVGRRLYIVQQGLPLARAGGGAFDIRLLMQKDRHGQWNVSSRVARLAAPGRLATNVFLGGVALGGSRVLRSSLGAAAPSRQQLADAGRAVASALETQLGQELGEVGIDFGIDRQGRIWVIEANSRPARNWPWPPETAAPRSVRITLENLLFRTGFLTSSAKGGSV